MRLSSRALADWLLEDFKTRALGSPCGSLECSAVVFATLAGSEITPTAQYDITTRGQSESSTVQIFEKEEQNLANKV